MRQTEKIILTIPITRIRDACEPFDNSNMRRRNIRPFSFQLILLLWRCLVLTEVAQGGAFPSPSADPAAAATPTEADIKTMLRDYIDTDKLGVGLVVGIVDEHGARVVSYGKLDNDTDQSVDGDAVFEIGSITKVFTALLLQDMVKRGEMNLDDPVQKYLPDSVQMPTYDGKRITLLHLATHTSGLPRDADNLSNPTWQSPIPNDVYTVQQLYSFLSHHKLRSAPGTAQEYSNLGFQLLGHVIALKAGTNYETLVRERICVPLGMESTRITMTPELKPRLAIGHVLPGGRAGRDYFEFLPGAGGLLSTANDLNKFLSAYSGLRPSPLSSLMQTAQSFHSFEDGAKRRLAWGNDDTLFSHNGATYGYHTLLRFDTRKRRGIVVLSNCSSSEIVDAVLRHLLDGPAPKPANPVSIDPGLYDRYAGQYRLISGEICVVRREGGRLMLQWFPRSGQPKRSFEVFPQSDSVFVNKFCDIQATFPPMANGQAPRLILTSLGIYSGFNDQLKLVKTSTGVPKTWNLVNLDSKAYDNFVGKYRKTLLFGLIRVGPTLSISDETDWLGHHLVASARSLPGYSVAEFFPVSDTSFIVNPMSTGDNIRLTFVRKKKGKATGVIVIWNGSKHSGSRSIG